MKGELPNSVKACLWSYDTARIDLSLSDHRQRVIENVLNRGTNEAVDWLLANFTRSEIAEAITRSSVASWDKRSLSLWSLVFDARPGRTARFA